MKNNILNNKNINIKFNFNNKPIFILKNGIKIFLIKNKNNNNNIIDIELKINHPFIKDKYFFIIKFLLDDIIKFCNNYYTYKKINKILMNNCADLYFNYKGFKLNLYKDNIKNIFKLINNIFIKNFFTNKKKFINILKKIIIYIKLYENNPYLIINNLKNKLIYNNYYNIKFFKKNINNIKFEKIKNIFKKYFIPNNSYLFFYGNISKSKVIYFTKKYFSNWKYKIKKNNNKILKIKNNNKLIFINYSKLNNNIILKLTNIINYNINDKTYIMLLLLFNLLKKKKFLFLKNKYIKDVKINIYINKYQSNIDCTIYTLNKNIYLLINEIKFLIYKIYFKKINIKDFQLIKNKLINNLLINYDFYKLQHKLIYNSYIYNFKNNFSKNIIKIIYDININNFYKFLKLIYNKKYFKNIIIGNNTFFYKEDLLTNNVKIDYINIYGKY
ncbi:MAG: insulinase family protein [Candidatus Shikimatogenerans sp. Tcar]|uniref:Insulinase family protein n=1 Tax=Candidatus Shikimatogenerans sp. Tcar TaxID=3158565 RepID=A0AAU7QSG6_9FLAO